MTEHLTMNTVIHAAFRRDLARFDSALATFPDGSQERADQLVAAWDNYSHQLHHHHQDEETIFWPAFRELGADESLTSDLGGEHARMLSALDHADVVVRRLPGDPSASQGRRRTRGDRPARGGAPRAPRPRGVRPRAVGGHRGGHTAVKAAQAAVRKAHKGEGGTFVAWLMDGAAPEDVAALKKEIPPPVVAVLNAIPGRQYRKNIAPVWSS